MKFILRRKLTYTVKGDAYWAADKLRQHLAQSLEEFEIFEVGPIDGEQFPFKRKLWHWRPPFDRRYFTVPLWSERGYYKGTITVNHEWNHVVVAYQLDFTAAVVAGWIITGLLLLFWFRPNFAQMASSTATARFSPVFLLMEFSCFFFWLLGLVMLSGLSVMMTNYFFGRFLKGSVNKFFHLMADLGIPLEIADTH